MSNMKSFPIIDRNGHKYHTRQQAESAIEYLEQDAGYLDEVAALASTSFVRDKIEANARNSQDYADEIRDALDEIEDSEACMDADPRVAQAMGEF